MSHAGLVCDIIVSYIFLGCRTRLESSSEDLQVDLSSLGSPLGLELFNADPSLVALLASPVKHNQRASTGINKKQNMRRFQKSKHVQSLA